MTRTKHPAGLYVLFFTEMWERFSYYGMRALLILYMVNYLRMTQENASNIYKWYTSLVYLTPIIGGYLADRYLGNKRAVIIGAVLMAIGHFLMASEPLFYAALVFLIAGNGFFKPNMSTQVGRLYPAGDARRDGAYTIFYMGINLGAFLSPLICGWLADHTPWRYHAGFAAAGVGMVCGLLVYLIGLRWVVEIDETGQHSATPLEGVAEESGLEGKPEDRHEQPITEREADATPSAAPALNRVSPALLAVVGVGLAVATPALLAASLIARDTLVSLEIVAACSLIAAWILSKVHNALRDRVLAIYALAVFVVFFWAAFEQAGNAMNLWADKTTNRYLTTDAPPPSVYPESAPTDTAALAGPRRTLFERWNALWNPVPTAWFQSINALAIFLLAPLFAWLWTALARRGRNLSIPTKMVLGVLLMASAFGLMMGAAKSEDQPTSTLLSALPDQIKLNDAHQLCEPKDGKLQPYHAGRLTYDRAAGTLHMTGVLPDVERDRIVRDTAPPDFKSAVEELQRHTREAAGNQVAASARLDRIPPGFDLRYAGLPESEVSFDPTTQTLRATVRLADKDVKALWVAAGDPVLRAALNDLFVKSAAHRVSPSWLFWFYILSTLGELCLSPVGLSMVSKLAPARFATMLMGLWLLTSFFGNFAAGAFGEIWGAVPPLPYFAIFLAALTAAALVLLLLVRKIVSMMHGVN